MNNEATHVKTQEDYSKFSSIVNEFLQEQMNEDFMEKNLLEAGVTSLQMMRISNALRKHGYKISFAKMISDPYVKHWWDNADINVKRKSVPPLETSNNSPKQFPLTDVQYAYWVGRKEGQVLGGNACHAYFEFDPDTVNLERLQEAWEELQARHPMLRAKFNNNGTQEIMEKPYSAKLQIYDFRKSDDFEHDLLAVREKLSHRKLDIANGQVAELGISLLPEDKLRMHFDIDLLVADMQSLQIIFRDLAAIYNSEYRPAIPENWDFGIYLENEKNNKINDYRKAEKYWKSEIESLPLGPALTLRTQPETIAAPKFSRRKYLLEHKKWEKLKSLAAQYCTTPAMVLLTLYAAVLDRWSTNQSFLINMPLFDRNTEIENIDNVIADFTNVLLFHADCKENCTFYEQLQKVQNQFRESVDNSEYSGVQVVRELSKLHPGEKCIAPVVFSCNYGTPFVDDKFEKTFGSLNYMVSQTPQVWIDFQIFEINNGLNLSWDAVDELFPDGMLDKMFAAFVAMLNELVSVKDWNKYVELLPDLAQERGIDNITEYYGNGQLLHSAFFVNAVKKKNQIAIIDENDGRNYTYEEVANKAKRVSSYLKEQGVAPGDLLAVSLSRGINQIISILGILAAGAGYIPINVNQPLSRRERIYSKSDIKFAITDTRLKKELEWPETVAMHYFDVVLAVSTLHRCRDIKASLKHAGEYLRAGGLLILLETTENTILQHVSTGILEKGFSTVTDERKGTGKPLLTKDQWSDAVLKCGFAKVNTAPNDQLDLPIYNQGVIVALAQPETYAFNSTKLKAYLENMIPSYMIPTAFMEIDKFPLSANGKVDRKALPVPVGETRENAKDQFQEPETAVEKELAAIWKTVLHTENISRNDNYFELGGDSLLATQLNAEINKKFNINLSLEKIFSNPIFAEQAISIASMLEDCEVKNMNAEKLEMVSPKPKEWGEPFPLTDVQQSYWLGRNGGFALGDVSTHCYFEMDCGGLDTDLAEEKWRRLILRHGMMRAVFLNDGQNQKILSNVPEYEIKVYDLASQEETVDEKLESIRKEMAYQIFDTSKWPLFDVRFSKLPGGNVRLHISFDNIIFDGWSMFLILREWKMLYDNPEKEVEPLDLSFRDYVLAYEDIKKTEFYKRDEEYWQKRLPDIFPAPELPVIKENGNTAVQKFIRYESKLTGSQWSAIKNMASQNGLTASGVLMTAYAEVLGRWSKSQKFTINLTRFNRLPIHNQIMDVVGDFTSLTLLSIDNTAGKSFLERCKNLQQQLWSDLAHPYYSGVELEREISKKQEIRNAAIMPIVFTSGLGIKQGGSNEQEEYFGEMVYGLSQTPQVWIDHQVTEQNERLVLTWDAVQDIFPAGVLDEMFAAYISLLEVLSTEQEAWNRESNSLVQIPNMENRELANSVNGKIPDETLISLVEKSMKENPERIAIINNERKLSYGELERYSTGIGHILQRENVERNSLVAIVMEKGWEQIVAAISILKAGAAYLPIDPSFPEERVHLLLKNASVKVVLTQEKVNREVNWPEDTTIICVDGVDVESIDTTDFESIATGNDLAYVIYTSGSTGMPKGVMIEHRAAVNTIIDVNERFAVGKDDKCIALSNLNFDLSVYDIFGLLIAGGTVVIPDAKQVKEPQHWLEIMQENKITVWNSVPAFMQMFMEFLSTKPDTKLPLRVVIMSGDWIPMELPEMIKMHSESVRMISMGGATEASIWSNYYEVESVKDGWTSIPYGKPLTNQKFYVLDQEMNDCPNWVAGRLFIAGEGLARGYWKDRKRTEERFINHPVTHERLYYTGDLGRYWPDGNIEFLGREDTQVKVRGHRIELGEAENVLLTHELIKSAVVVVEEDKSGLAAAVVLNEDSDCCDNKNVEKILHEYLGKKLPEYMVPGKILVMEQLPLSVNGKVDRKALRKILGGYQGQISEEKKKEAPQGELEVKIAAIWERVLGTKEISRDDDFFMCGGDSLKAVKIISELNATEGLPNDLAIQTLFALPTVALLAEQIEKLVSLLDVEENTEYEEGVL